MTTKYCPGCGTSHDCTAVEGSTVSDAVRIAELETKRDVEIAKINSRQDKDWNETRVEVAGIEAEAEVAVAVAEGEVIGAAIEAGAVADESAEPVIIDAPPVDDDQGDDVDDLPPVDGTPVPTPPKHKTLGLGAW